MTQEIKNTFGLAALLAALPFSAQAAPLMPDAGSILQQVIQSAPQAPSSSETGLTIRHEGGEKLPPSAPFQVNSIRITGNILFDTATLHALVADAEGKMLKLSDLDGIAARITDYYHAHGYPFARAIIPPQTIHDGIVEIKIIEARYGQVSLDNKSHVKDNLLQDTLIPLKSGGEVEQVAMDHSLLLLSDIPGVLVDATLIPGEAVGTSDLLIDTTAGPSILGNAAVDNYGNQYTGRARAGGTVNFIDPMQHGDMLSLAGLTSGSGMNYGRVAYDTMLDGRGTHLGGSLSALHYILGDSFSTLGGHGTAQVGSLWLKQTLMRRRDANLYAQVQYDHKGLSDRLDVAGIKDDRHLDNETVSVFGDARRAGGITIWSVGLTTGRVGFDNMAAQLTDTATTQTQGTFSKWNASISDLQSLTPNNALYLAMSGQWATKDLDTAEKMTLGGPYTVRAYDMGIIAGDTGYLGTAELRHDLGGPWQGVLFIDSAHVTVNQNPWVAGVNDATLTGAGAGINWLGPKQWSAKAYVAARLGATPILLAGAASTRLWVEVDRGF